ncbi:MAG: hypothetical protein ACOCRO_09420, partial [Halanaerobiales bacterium]
MLNIGCFGVGQGGINIAEQFAKNGIKTIVSDTSIQNLQSCKHIKDNLRIHTKINEHGGAGKEISKGETSIITYEDKIKNAIKLELSGKDLVIITAGLGGGTGTLGCTQVSLILAKLGIQHCMMVTLPEKYEGTDEKANSPTGLYAIEQLRRKIKNLRSIAIIENQKLKGWMKENTTDFTGWDKGNKFIVNRFLKIVNFTQNSSNYTVDGEDLIKVITKRGYIIFDKLTTQFENKTKSALFPEVKESWENSVFTKLDTDKAKGLAVMVNRPKSIEGDGDIIDNLKENMMKSIGSGTFAFGRYEEDSWTDKMKERISMGNKPLEIYTILSGMPFPIKRFNDLKMMAEKEVEEYKKKE